MNASKAWWIGGVHSERFSRHTRETLGFLFRRPALAILLATSIPMVGFMRVGSLKNQFFPGADRNQIQVQVWAAPQSPIRSTADSARRIEDLIRQNDEVKRVDWLVGGSIPTMYYNLTMNQDDAPNYAQAIVTTEGTEEQLVTIKSLQKELDASFPESQIVVRQLAQGPPVIAPIEIRIFGPSVRRLRELGQDLQRVLYETAGVIHTRTTFDVGRAKAIVQPNESEARLAGLSLNDLAGQLQTNLEGATGGVMLEATEQLPVRIRLNNQIRGEISEIASSRIQVNGSGDGASWMPLESVAQIELRPEEAGIARRNGERCNTIQAFVVADALPPEVTERFLERLDEAEVQIPAGYRLQVGGDSEELANSMANLFAYAPVLGVLIFSTLILSFRSFVLAGIIGAVAALSAGLAFFSIWVAGYPLGFNPLIGMAGLIGLAINDSIVVLTQIRSNPLAKQGDVSAIVEEVMKTARHVISTTLTTIGGFLPLLIGGGTFWPPLAVVIAGGVGGATILATIFVPAAYVVVGRLVDGQQDESIDSSSVKEPVEVGLVC